MEGLFTSNEIIDYIKEQKKNGLSQTAELSLYFKATQKSLDEGLPNLQLWLDYIQVLRKDKECVEEIRNIFVCILKPRYKKFVLFWEGYLEFEKSVRGDDFFEKVGRPSLRFVEEKNFANKNEILDLIKRMSGNNCSVEFEQNSKNAPNMNIILNDHCYSRIDDCNSINTTKADCNRIITSNFNPQADYHRIDKNMNSTGMNNYYSLDYLNSRNVKDKEQCINVNNNRETKNYDLVNRQINLELNEQRFDLNNISTVNRNEERRYDLNNDTKINKYDLNNNDFNSISTTLKYDINHTLITNKYDLNNKPVLNRNDKSNNSALNRNDMNSISTANKYDLNNTSSANKHVINSNTITNRYDMNNIPSTNNYDMNHNSITNKYDMNNNTTINKYDINSISINKKECFEPDPLKYKTEMPFKKRIRQPLSNKNTNENIKSLSHCTIATPYSGNCDENLRIDMKCDTTNLGSVDLNLEMDGFGVKLEDSYNKFGLGGADELQWIQFKNRKVYKIKQIGSGGTSKVYQVLYNKEIYALKHVNIKEEVKESYLNEIKLLEKLKNKTGIIKIIDYELAGKDLFLILECGETNLHKLMKNRLNINFIKYIWEQMLTIVEIVHDERIIHKDLKPQNFVLVKGELKLIDFGISKELKNDTTKIINDSLVGTIEYMSPESINSDLKLGKSTDVWSLGIILYEIVYGETPFKKYKTLVQKINAFKELKIEYKESEFVTLVDVIKLCLNVDRTKRMTVKELLWMCKNI